jgi:hypothetical protein
LLCSSAPLCDRQTASCGACARHATPRLTPLPTATATTQNHPHSWVCQRRMQVRSSGPRHHGCMGACTCMQTRNACVHFVCIFLRGARAESACVGRNEFISSFFLLLMLSNRLQQNPTHVALSATLPHRHTHTHIHIHATGHTHRARNTRSANAWHCSVWTNT